jgi:hypothetical protein
LVLERVEGVLYLWELKGGDLCIGWPKRASISIKIKCSNGNFIKNKNYNAANKIYSKSNKIYFRHNLLFGRFEHGAITSFSLLLIFDSEWGKGIKIIS